MARTPDRDDDGAPAPDAEAATSAEPDDGRPDGDSDDRWLDGVEAARDRARRREATLARDLADIVASMVDSNSDDEHDPDGATIAFERAQVTELLRTTRVELAALDAAVARIAVGTYGRCEHCGRAIAPARLAVRPAAATCIDCA